MSSGLPRTSPRVLNSLWFTLGREETSKLELKQLLFLRLFFLWMFSVYSPMSGWCCASSLGFMAGREKALKSVCSLRVGLSASQTLDRDQRRQVCGVLAGVSGDLKTNFLRLNCDPNQTRPAKCGVVLQYKGVCVLLFPARAHTWQFSQAAGDSRRVLIERDTDDSTPH